MYQGERYIQAEFSYDKEAGVFSYSEQSDIEGYILPIETERYSIAPFEGRYIGKCTQIAYSVNPVEEEKNGLTDAHILILVKTPIDPFDSFSTTGHFFDAHHFNHSDRIPLRVSSACLPGSMGDLQCNCHIESIEYMRDIGDKGMGIFVYMPQEALGRGLREKVRDHRLIFGIDNHGNKVPPMTEEQAMNTLHPKGYDNRAYFILKDVFHELGLGELNFEFLGENEKKRVDIIDQTGLTIEKKSISKYA